jgi:hypothetical protein
MGPQYSSGEQKANTIFRPLFALAVLGAFFSPRATAPLDHQHQSALQSLPRFSKELNYPRARITCKIQKCLSEQFLS